MLNVTLFDVNKKLCEEWEKVFSPYKNVNIQNIKLDKLDTVSYTHLTLPTTSRV